MEYSAVESVPVGMSETTLSQRDIMVDESMDRYDNSAIGLAAVIAGHVAVFGEFEPTTEIEAHAMAQAAGIIHGRLVEELEALPWWRFGLRRGIRFIMRVPGGACFEWATAADRLAEESQP